MVVNTRLYRRRRWSKGMSVRQLKHWKWSHQGSSCSPQRHRKSIPAKHLRICMCGVRGDASSGILSSQACCIQESGYLSPFHWCLAPLHPWCSSLGLPRVFLSLALLGLVGGQQCSSSTGFRNTSFGEAVMCTPGLNEPLHSTWQGTFWSLWERTRSYTVGFKHMSSHWWSGDDACVQPSPGALQFRRWHGLKTKDMV